MAEDGVAPGPQVRAVDFLELLGRAPLAVEQLNHRHPAQVLVEEGIDACQRDAGAAETVADIVTEEDADGADQGQDGEHE